MSRIPLIYHTNKQFYTQYTHPMLICRGTDARADRRTEKIYSIFRDKLLLLGEHVQKCRRPPHHRWIDLEPTHSPLCSGAGATDDQRQLSPPMPPSPPEPRFPPTRQYRHLTLSTVGCFNGICNKRSLTCGIRTLYSR